MRRSPRPLPRRVAVALAAALFSACAPPPSTSTTDAGPADAAMPSGPFAHWPKGPAPLQVKLPTVMMTPGQEVDDAYSATLSNPTPVWVYNITWDSSPGLHHSRVDVNDVGLAFSLAVGQRTGGQEFPMGYAMQLPARSKITISYHYINATPQNAPIDALVQFYPIPDMPAVTPIPTGFVPMLYLPIHIPAHSTKEVVSTCPLPQDVELHALLSHIHARGRHIEASIVGGANDGLKIYSTDLWDNAPINQYLPTIKLKAGDAIRYSCRWQNDGDAAIGFGMLAADEMCGIGGWMSPVPLGLNGVVATENAPCTFNQQ